MNLEINSKVYESCSFRWVFEKYFFISSSIFSSHKSLISMSTPEKKLSNMSAFCLPVFFLRKFCSPLRLRLEDSSLWLEEFPSFKPRSNGLTLLEFSRWWFLLSWWLLTLELWWLKWDLMPLSSSTSSWWVFLIWLSILSWTLMQDLGSVEANSFCSASLNLAISGIMQSTKVKR